MIQHYQVEILFSSRKYKEFPHTSRNDTVFPTCSDTAFVFTVEIATSEGLELDQILISKFVPLIQLCNIHAIKKTNKYQQKWKHIRGLTVVLQPEEPNIVIFFNCLKINCYTMDYLLVKLQKFCNFSCSH